MSNEVPEPWAAAMIAAGLVDPRYKKRQVPSMRQLADAAETYTSTISHMMAGTRETGSDVVDRVAAALGADRALVGRWVGRARTAPKPFEPHRDADLLTSEEQEAVNELIRLLALSKKKGAANDSAATNQVPEVEPAGQSTTLTADLAAYGGQFPKPETDEIVDEDDEDDEGDAQDDESHGD